MRVVAEWNIRQEDLEEAHQRRSRGRRSERPPARQAGAQSPRAGVAALAKAKQAVNVSDGGASFWFSHGLVHAS